MIHAVSPPDPAAVLDPLEGAARWLVAGWGRAGGDAGRFVLGRWLFLRLLGLVWLVAFLSLWRQVEGLVGEEGILPARDHLERVREAGGADPLRVPTLFWLGAGDRALHLACGAGVVLAGLLTVNVAPVLCLAGLWILYLSFAAVGQVFLSYQWDVLLLEASFLALVLAPWSLLPGAGAPTVAGLPVGPAPTATPAVALVLAWWLVFRLHFQSGAGKLTSGDAAWRDLTALRYHWWTQPLPTWTAWWMDELPGPVHRAGTAATHLIEVVLPLLIFAPREARLAACVAMVALQVAILATGNYNFFNVLTVALCLLLVDDAAWAALLPGGVEALATAADLAPGASPLRTGAAALLALPALALGGLHVRRTLAPDRPLPEAAEELLRWIGPFRTFNSYGLFRVMTKERPEIVVQGSRDGESWEDYGFAWKPDDPRRRPRFCAPHQPRLDWQMWFAALRGFRRAPWFRAFLARLLEGSEPVTGLLARNPFPDEPPRYVRALLYRYRFTDREERRRTGRWWKRERTGLYAPVMRREADPGR